MRIKVCGITDVKQLKELESLGVDHAGLIFYPGSPRYVAAHGLEASMLKKEKLNISKIGVFVNAPEEDVLRHVDTWGLEMVQLHGEESPSYCERISNHVKTIKAFRVNPAENLIYKVFPYKDSVEYYLFDTMGEKYGGTGKQFDWQLVGDREMDKPYFLSGGIGIDQAEAVNAFAISQKDLYAIDVNSKFEVSPGIKNMDLVKQFCAFLKNQ